MSYYIHGNRINTEEEENREKGAEAIGGMLAVMLFVLFILSPGIFITAFIQPIFHFNVSQLWGSAIVGSIVAAIAIHYSVGLTFSRYLICGGICGGFIILLTLFVGENMFTNTIKEMFDIEQDTEKQEQENIFPAESKLDNSTINFTEVYDCKS